MEEFNFNMSGVNSLNYINMSFNSFFSDLSFAFQIINWMNWITISIGLPLVLIVIITIIFQVKKGQDAPVYVINLLVSDLIQLCFRIPVGLYNPGQFICLFITSHAVMVSVGFMVCISCERYLVVAKPLWYRFRRNIKTYVVVCIVVWILPLFFPLFGFLTPDGKMVIVIFIVFLLLPFPLLIFFLVGTIKALSGALSVPADEKRRIAAIQAVVLINYALLYLPFIILLLPQVSYTKLDIFSLVLPSLCIFLSPLADTTLYLLSRKSIMDKFLASICSCKTSSNLEMSSTDYDSRTGTNTETV